MRRIRIAIAALALGILTACAHSAFAAPEQGKRVALVVGNGAYQHARHLKNPENDAAAVADALLRLGFEVRKETDLDKRRFDQVMPEFAEMATGAEIALVYFSGHAMELQGIPYLMPTDAQPISRSHIRNQLKSVRDIVFDLEGVSGLKLVVVDGCRDNPLAANLLRALGLPRSASDTTRGFLSADAERQQLGELIIAFATLQGEPAYDGTELNSPFTTAFLNHVGEDGIEVDQLFRKVKDDVVSATQRMQTPMIESYRGNRTFVLRPGATLPQPASAKSRRLALVIGNSAYLHAPPVKSAVNDAILLSDKLKEVGFEVQLEKNLDGRLIFEKVQQFHAKVDPETEVALIYYTGYGVQFLGQNFLIGIDARPKSQERLFVETFPLNKLIDMFDKRSVATLLFWDACRSHPFTEEYPGVARPPQSKGDTLILLSAEANKQCPEASGEHSVFAEALARHIPTRDVEIETVLKRASAEVRERTQKLQEPERITQLRREFYFRREGPEEAAYQEEIRKQSQLVALQRESTPRKQFKIIGLDQKDSPKSTPAASPPAPWGPTRGPGPGGPPADAAAMKAVAGSETTAAHSASGNVVIEADRAASTIVRKLRISPDGKLLAVGDDEGFIRIVRLESFEVIATIPAHAGRISDLDFSPDSRILLSAGRDRLLRFWDLSNLSRSPVRELKAPGSMPYSARINSNMPDRFVLMGDRDGRVVAWDLKRNHIITNSKFHQGPVNSVAYQPGGNGTYLSAGADGQLKIRLPEGQRLTLHPHNGVMFQASYSASGKLVYTVGADRTAKIWDAAASGRQLAVMSGHFKYVLTADMSPDEKLLVTGGGDKVLNLWDVASGALRGQMKGHTSDIEAVAFSPNGKFVVSASEDKSVIIWSVENQEALATLFFQKNGDKYAGVTFDNQAFGERNSGLLSVYVDGRQVSGPEAERVVRYIGRGIAIIENEN